MAARILNIELSDHICKVCITKQRGKHYQVLGSFMLGLPQETVQDGFIHDIATLGEMIKDELIVINQKRIKLVNFVLTSARVVSREVNLPPMKETRIKMAVEANAGDYFPVDINSYMVSHCVLEKLTGESPGWRVQVVAAPKSLLECYVALAESLGMHVNAIDYCGNSQYQLLRGIPSQDVTVYVDVNEGNTFVSFISQGVLLLQRNITAGAGELVTELCVAMEQDSYLEMLNRSANDDYLYTSMTQEEISYTLSRVIGGIGRSVDYFVSNHQDKTIAKVVLMGTCSWIAGLCEAVWQEVGIETTLLEAVEGVRISTNFTDFVSCYVNSIGTLVAPLDLIPESARKKKDKKQESSMTFSILLCILIILAGLALCLFSDMDYKAAVSKRNTLEKRMEELSYVKNVYNAHIGYEKTLANLEGITTCSDTPMASLYTFLEEMEEKMPSGMMLVNATVDNTGITMNITVNNLEEADVVLSKLRAFQSIGKMVVSTITETTSDEGVTSASFSVNCEFVQTEAETFDAQ